MFGSQIARDLRHTGCKQEAKWLFDFIDHVWPRIPGKVERAGESRVCIAGEKPGHGLVCVIG